VSNRATSRQQEKGKPVSDKAGFLSAADDLFRETVAITAREKVFPKRTRWQFAYALMDIANNFHTEVMYANGIEVEDHELFAERYRAQTRGLAWLYALDAKMSAAQLCMNINADLLDYWTQLLNEAKARTSKWRSSDKSRYSKRFGSLTAEETREPAVYDDPVRSVRSPNPSNANNVRNSNTDGALNNNNANNTNGVVADREKASDEYAHPGGKQCAHTGGWLPAPALG
jgi:hypothetical protein